MFFYISPPAGAREQWTQSTERLMSVTCKLHRRLWSAFSREIGFCLFEGDDVLNFPYKSVTKLQSSPQFLAENEHQSGVLSEISRKPRFQVKQLQQLHTLTNILFGFSLNALQPGTHACVSPLEALRTRGFWTTTTTTTGAVRETTTAAVNKLRQTEKQRGTHYDDDGDMQQQGGGF